MKLLIITPVRNESRYIEKTINCMLLQTTLPNKWIIVNDGSTDRTEDIVKEYANKYSFIDVVTLENRGCRKPGIGVIIAFYEGLKTVNENEYDIIAKLDADIEFPDKTIEIILESFKKHKYLGIVGGKRYERSRKNRLIKDFVPIGYVCGSTKFYRRKCLYDIGGLNKRIGWDGVDIVRANKKGWKTGEIDKIRVVHLKKIGMAKGEGLRKANIKYGNVSYYMGGYFVYFILRMIYRSIHQKKLTVFIYMLIGYINAKRKREIRETKEYRKYLKKMQRNNLKYFIKYIFGYRYQIK